MRWTLEQRRAVCHPISALFKSASAAAVLQPEKATVAAAQASLMRRSYARWQGWRLRATPAKLPDGDAELPRLVGQVLLDARAGEDHDADRQHVEHLIVALEGCCLGMLGPIRLEGDLRHLAVVGPASGDTLGALRRTAVQQHHVRMLGVN